jgi:hypothetical protein
MRQISAGHPTANRAKRKRGSLPFAGRAIQFGQIANFTLLSIIAVPAPYLLVRSTPPVFAGPLTCKSQEKKS